MVFWNQNTTWGFIISELIILFLLLSALEMMIIGDHNDVWWPEIILVRSTFSIYAGWLTSATLLNTVYLLKSWGMSDYRIRDKKTGEASGWDFMKVFMFVDEEFWTCLLIGFAEVFYTTIAWVERNPAYGSVWIWALYAIVDDNSK